MLRGRMRRYPVVLPPHLPTRRKGGGDGLPARRVHAPRARGGGSERTGGNRAGPSSLGERRRPPIPPTGEDRNGIGWSVSPAEPRRPALGERRDPFGELPGGD